MIVPPRPGRRRGFAASATRGGPDMGWLSHERLGFNYRLTELQAAIGVVQLERAGRAAR